MDQIPLVQDSPVVESCECCDDPWLHGSWKFLFQLNEDELLKRIFCMTEYMFGGYYVHKCFCVVVAVHMCSIKKNLVFVSNNNIEFGHY